jgi:glutamyl-tRNA reductase
MSSLLVNGAVTFHEAPVEIRERIAFPDALLPRALCHLKLHLQLSEAVLLSTCNRVEYFGLAQDRDYAEKRWPEFLREFHGLPGELTPYCRHRRARECVDHLFQLASGLESMVVGETEILGQIKDSYECSRRLGQTQKHLNRLFQSSFAAAKAVRSGTQITRGSVSVGSVAVELAGKLFGSLENRRVMILGAGEMSERTARSLQSRGVTWLIVANRTRERAAQLAAALGGEDISWEQFEQRVNDVDIIICSTAAPHYILSQEKLLPMLSRRGGRPLFLIDLSVPRNIEPSLHYCDDVYVYDIDDLQGIASRNQRERAAETQRCQGILSPHIEQFLEWEQRQGAPVSLPPAKLVVQH